MEVRWTKARDEKETRMSDKDRRVECEARGWDVGDGKGPDSGRN